MIKSLQKIVDECDIVVGFNFKFDYHWLSQVGLRLEHKTIWDCQIAEFVLERQQNKYPSLEDSAIKYGLGNKIDVIKTEYWDKGIDTDAIPWPVLKAYAVKDAELTFGLYNKQVEQIQGKQLTLIKLLNADLHVLKEMEANGLRYDSELCKVRSEELEARMSEIKAELSSIYPDVPINWASGDHLSAFLYGGTITVEEKEHIGFFKTGEKKGQPKYQKVERHIPLPRLYEPLKGSALKKEGMYATNQDTLLKLKGKKGPIQLLLELAKLEKLNGTYYKGLPELNEQMNWEEGMLHGSLNQCTTYTGRLSSNKPNMQNFAGELQDIFVTRYAD